MCQYSQKNLLLAAIVIIRAFSFLDGQGLCISSYHKELEPFYKSFMHLYPIGVIQCLKVCKRYKLCKKIKYDRDHLTCDLMMVFDEELKKPLSLITVSTVQTNSRSCSHDSCSETEDCIDQKNGQHICLAREVCPSADWLHFRHKCYLFPGAKMTTKKNWEICRQMNTSQLRIDNKGVNNFLRSQLRDRDISGMWIAAQAGKIMNWIWESGGSITNANWGPDEPDRRGKRRCAEIQSNAEWISKYCDFDVSYAACEVQYAIMP
ncbi:low affinity immunoglobulin epsilon Fc receptor-like [Ylistrum balloti]|uniref:low affinity immunoglobulin epsilon Fc receptor-like n=1 Tax=Ylistrum balloti TaxID=509963 RepID=UPI002905E85B|nr:low affinity immunoglobulin epsilon Fc receptor-like [Ylistrum balloti]